MRDTGCVMYDRHLACARWSQETRGVKDNAAERQRLDTGVRCEVTADDGPWMTDDGNCGCGGVGRAVDEGKDNGKDDEMSYVHRVHLVHRSKKRPAGDRTHREREIVLIAGGDLWSAVAMPPLSLLAAPHPGPACSNSTGRPTKRQE